MPKRPLNTTAVIALIFTAACTSSRDLPARGDETSPEFGVMANSDDMRRMPVAQLASAMKEIGYASVALSDKKHKRLDGMMKACRDAGLRVGAVCVRAKTDGESVSFNVPIDWMFDRLRNTDAVVMLVIKVAEGAKVTDQRVAEQLLPLAKQAEKAGVTIAIYPHFGDWLSTFEHAARIADAVDHPSLGVCFNLSHYLKQNDARDLPSKLRAAKDRIMLVTIHGSAVGNTQSMGWDKLIQQIDQGEFDLKELLDLICVELKFDGPIFVQCYNLKAPTRTILQDTFDCWQCLKKHCRKPRHST